MVPDVGWLLMVHGVGVVQIFQGTFREIISLNPSGSREQTVGFSEFPHLPHIVCQPRVCPLTAPRPFLERSQFGAERGKSRVWIQVLNSILALLNSLHLGIIFLSLYIDFSNWQNKNNDLLYSPSF